MKYDGQKLIAPDASGEVVVVWDYTSDPGGTGETRWLCKAADGQLYLYWCQSEEYKDQGDWSNVSSGWWSDFAQNHPPVWGNSDTSQPASEAVKGCKCNLHQLMRGDGHDADCPEKPIRLIVT